MTVTWDQLNERQKTYLLFLYRQDQIQERAHKERSSQDHYDNTPARVWRTIEYADTYSGYTPLKRALIDAHLVDQGTGSTFKALEERGLIETAGGYWGATVQVWITRQGRKLVRDAQGITAPKTLPTGQLREWHWKALCRAFLCGADGMGYDCDTGDGYGYVSWKTCLRLRDYRVSGKERPLIRERRHSDPSGNFLLITDYGKQFVEEYREQYQALYPEVPIIHPSDKEEKNNG